jgi:serine/threonine protein kinase/tetratricopeptide (TPR) repeat protein
MAEGSLFGLDPKTLKRLAALGFEGSDSDKIDDSPTHPAPHPFVESLDDWIGPYRLLSILGEGGMGVVYLAEQTRPVKRHVALKIVKPGMDSKQVLARFEVEQQALALMEHPHVARVLDAGLAPSGRPYFVMEHVQGIPITEYSDKHQLTIEERLVLFLHVCEAVQHAHQKGIIHRDLKPSNILVAIQDKDAVPKVIDFGVARAISQPLTERTLYTEQGQFIGTPEYMSPEQAYLSNQDIDTRTDVYSLGVLLYELLTGLLPFDRHTFREAGIEHIRKVISEQDPATPSTRLSKTSLAESMESARRRQTDVRMLRHELRGDLDWITLKAMEKDRSRRYASVDAMAADVRHFLNHQPVSAAPPGVIYLTRKFVCRHRQAVVFFVMMALVLVGGSIALLMYGRAVREHHHAQSLEHRRLLEDAQELTTNRKYNEALTSLEELLSSPYIGRQAKLLRAQLLLEQKDVTAAIGELEGLVNGSDDISGQAHFLLAGIYYETDPWAPGKTQEYVAKWEHHTREAERLIAGTAQYYFLQAKAESDIKRKLALLGKTLELDKKHYESLRERAYIHYAQKNYHSMGRDAVQMIGLQTGNPVGYLLSALAAREQGLFEEAIADHSEAILLAPDDPALYEERRETFMRMGRYDSALADAQRASALEPENLPRHVQVFMAFTALGQYEQAQRHYERVIDQPWAQTEYSPWAWGTGSWNTRDWFGYQVAQYTSDALSRNQAYPSSVEQSGCLALWAMREAAEYYQRLDLHAQRVISGGFSPSWSVDSTKIAYSHGVYGASAVAILDLKTGETELLTMPGKDPVWSPDGKYIAYIRDRHSLSLDVVSKPTETVERHRKSGRIKSKPVEEIWVIEVSSHNIRYIAPGWQPAWSRDSKHLYYRTPLGTLCWTSIDEDTLSPTTVLDDCGGYSVISPDERYIADSKFRRFDVVEVSSRQPVITWLAPPSPCRGLLYQWRPDGLEIAIGGYHGSDMGLWILDTRTGKARRVIDGPATIARWSPDCSQMVIELGHPYFEIWLVDLDPNRPTAESFGDSLTEKQHCLELIETCNRSIAADPNYIDGHLCRTDAALWIQDDRANEFLEEMERVYRSMPYHAGGCSARAQAILSGTPELRDRLKSLALLLARKAVEKELENTDFLKTLGEAYYHTMDRENAEDILLKAFKQSIVGDSDDSQIIEIIQLLIKLYEAWNKPEEAEKWRAKQPQTEAMIE